MRTSKIQNSKASIAIIKKMPDFKNDPFVIKKREDAIAHLQQIGLIKPSKK